MDRPLKGFWTPLDGQRVFARVSSGHSLEPRTPFVLVHGLGVSSRYMVPTARRLAGYAPVYAPDLPGFGKSSHPSHALSVAELADVLVRWMRAVGIDRAALLGNSMGCQIIAHVAVAHPEMVERVIFVGPTMDDDAGALTLVGRLLLDVLRELRRSLPLFVVDYLRAGLLRTVTTYRHALRDDTLRLYARMRQPTLVVRGERDPIAPQAWARRLTDLLPHGRLAVVPGAAHAVNYFAPEELTRLIRDFLSDTGDVRSATREEAPRA